MVKYGDSSHWTWYILCWFFIAVPKRSPWRSPQSKSYAASRGIWNAWWISSGRTSSQACTSPTQQRTRQVTLQDCELDIPDSSWSRYATEINRISLQTAPNPWIQYILPLKKKTTSPWSAMYHVLKIGDIPKKCYLMIGKRMINYGSRPFLGFPPAAGDDHWTGDYPVAPPHKNPAVTGHLAMPNLRPLEQLQTQLLYIWRWMNQASVSKGNLGGIAIAHRLSPVARWDLWFKSSGGSQLGFMDVQIFRILQIFILPSWQIYLLLILKAILEHSLKSHMCHSILASSGIPRSWIMNHKYS